MATTSKNKPYTWLPHDGSEQTAGNVSRMTIDSRMEGDVLVVTEMMIGKTGTRTYHWYYDMAARLRSTSGCLDDAIKSPMSECEVKWVQEKRMPAPGLVAQVVVESGEAVAA